MLTGESWSEAVARPVVFGDDVFIRGALFYTSYILICGIVLVNVAVAVLLEKMVDGDDSHEEEEEEGAPADPLLRTPSPSPGLGGSPAAGKWGDVLKAAVPKTPKLSNAARDALLVQMQQEVVSVREEAAAREAAAKEREKRLLQALDAVQTRLGMLDTLSNEVAAVSANTFKRRRNKGARGGEAHGHSPAAQEDAAMHEDRAQDGERSLSRGAPGRFSRQGTGSHIELSA